MELIKAHTEVMEEAAATRAAIKMGAQAIAQQVTRLDQLMHDMAERTRAQEKMDEAEEIEGWKQWIRQGVDCGARNAHKYSRTPDRGCLRRRDAKSKAPSPRILWLSSATFMKNIGIDGMHLTNIKSVHGATGLHCRV